VTIEAEPAAPLAVFRVEGWEPNNAEDEAQGHKLLILMEGIGAALADDKLTAEDVVHLVVPLNLPGGKAVEMLVPIAQEVIAAVNDDGKLTADEVLGIVAHAVRDGLGVFTRS
jgi:hypothetical protein